MSPAYFVLATDSAVPRFGEYLLRSKPYVAKFGAASDGVRIGQWDLNIPRMRNIEVLLPPRGAGGDREVLAHANARIDKAISAKRCLIALLEEQQRAGTEFVIYEAASDAVEPLLGRELRRIEQGMSPPAREGGLAEDQWAVLSLSAVNRGVFSPTALKPVAHDLDVPTGLELFEASF